jgi:hypothetical protein
MYLEHIQPDRSVNILLEFSGTVEAENLFDLTCRGLLSSELWAQIDQDELENKLKRVNSSPKLCAEITPIPMTASPDSIGLVRRTARPFATQMRTLTRVIHCVKRHALLAARGAGMVVLFSPCLRLVGLRACQVA